MNRNTLRFGSCVAASAALALWGHAAAAQSAQSGLSLDRFNPAERGSQWFVLDSLDLRGQSQPAVGLTLDYADRPLSIASSDGTKFRLVRDQLLVHAGASLVLSNRVRFGISVPLALVNDGESGSIGGAKFTAPSGGGTGDIRLGTDVRLVGKTDEVFTAAIGAQMFLPTGSQLHYLGDNDLHGGPRAIVAGRIGGPESALAYSAMVAVHFRPHTGAVAGPVRGPELVYGAAAGARLLDGKLVIGPEFYASTAFDDFSGRTTPAELLIGGHYTVSREIRLGIGAGPGLHAAYGSPWWRGVASLEWAPAPPVPPADRDGDHVADAFDACPDVAGVATKDPGTNGCPPPPPRPVDTDGDGVPDAQDACPQIAGVPSADPKTNGCPPPPPPAPKDTDSDGVSDDQDACPTAPGVATSDPKTNGCPPAPKDTDGDGILDPQDACPNEAGPASADASKNGCPLAKVVGSTIVIGEQIHFRTGSAEILPESDSVMVAVLAVLKDHAEIGKVEIVGHTDNVGDRSRNKELSASRAAAVRAWLVKKGVAPARLVSSGLGDASPIAPNDTEQGRATNRRVDFNIQGPLAAP
jgi:outer membrane protein OmpA-like peptidoglycan-associated protein